MGQISLLKKKIIDRSKYIFTNRDLFKLFLPVIVEQFLEYLVGLADSIMVASVGESAVSGVSLVDFVMALLISLFAVDWIVKAIIFVCRYISGKWTKFHAI